MRMSTTTADLCRQVPCSVSYDGAKCMNAEQFSGRDGQSNFCPTLYDIPNNPIVQSFNGAEEARYCVGR